MSLTLVLGPANSAKAGEVLGAYAAMRRRSPLLVVPTWRDAELYTRELAAEEASIGGRVVTFAGLASEIARRTGYEARLVSPLQRERVVRRAVRRARLSALAESASSPGFAAAVLELIRELQRSLISPQRFARAAGDEIAAIYLAYTRELERLGRVDPELYAWHALDALRAAPASWGMTPVFVYGFDDLTPLERDAIETLSRIAGAAVTVSLNYEPGRAALAARAEAVEELRPLANHVVELAALDEHYEPSARGALHHLERGLFESAEPIDPGPAVRLLEAGGQRAEVELVAAEVLELLHDGVPGEQIAVVYRSLSGVAPLIARVFGAYGIPVAVDRELTLGQTALGRGLLALARCALQPQADASELITYARTPGVVDRLEPVDRLEARILRDRIGTVAEARDCTDLRFRELDALRAADNVPRELERQARRLLAAPHRRQAAVLDPLEQLDAAAVTVVVRAFTELDELGERLQGAELIELLDRLTVPARSSPGPDAVLAADPLAIRARRFRAVFVCGLQEGEFPLRGAPDPLLSDERRRELAVSSGLRLRPREDALARERYLFYAAVSRATEHLVLSYRSSDEEGNIELASPFIADVAELFTPGWLERRRRRLLADVVWAPDEAPTERERERAQAAAGGHPGAPERERKLGEAALSRVRHRELVSAGALETYASCPVKWLVERELQPARLGPDPEPMVRGNFMHGLLEQLLSRLDRRLTPESLPDAERILAELLAEPPASIARGRPAGVRAAALRSIEADIRRYLAQEASAGGECRTEALELKFGFDEDGSLPALELDDGVRLRGVIDRVDVDASGDAIVRDYKTGNTRAEYAGARWSEDRQLQVALYMLAVRELRGLDPAAGLYQPLGGDDLRARGMFVDGTAVAARTVATDARSPQELSEALQDARERAVELAGRLRSGDLQPCPETCSRDGCAYPGICRSS